MPPELIAIINELATASPERRPELLAKLRAAGVPGSDTPKPQPPSTFVPKGCVRGRDGIIRTAPGVFEARYRRHVRRQVRIHMPARRESRPTGRRTTAHAPHGPPREPDDPSPSRPLDVVPLERFLAVLEEAGL